MKKRTSVYILVIAFALVSTVLLFVYFNSYSIALSKIGLSKNSVVNVDVGLDDNGNEYRIVFQYLPNNALKFAHLAKNTYGIWTVTEEAHGPDSPSQYISMGWMRIAGMRRYAMEDPNVEFEVHNMYGGMNAIEQVKVPVDLLPSNVTVNVFQAGELYVIHFIAYGNAEALNQIDFPQFLEQIDGIQ